MKAAQNHRARLLVPIPVERYTILSPSGRSPRVGDEVAIDQGFTSPDGLPMVLVYFCEREGVTQYEAEVYESELGPIVG